MALRSGLYIVPTDRWYVERAVWLIAGIVLLASTAVAATYEPLAALLIAATGISSIGVALTGFCLVGNVLHRLGMPHALGTRESIRGRWYFMQTDRWYLERRIYPIVGTNIAIASILSLVHSPWWLTFTGFVGVAMVWFAGTGFCILANVLYWSGVEPRLLPEQQRGGERSIPGYANQPVR
jgi:hypothetical protein